MPNYSPGLVPNNPGELRRFLQDELDRIAFALNGSIKAGYGGVASSEPVELSLSETPVLFDVYGKTTPARPLGVEPDDTDGSITALDAGVYFIGFTGTVSNLPNATLAIEFRINDVAVRTIVVDPSNQTFLTTVSYNSFARLERGDRLDAWAFLSTGVGLVTFGSCSMIMHRISDDDGF